jgi:glutaredoxin
MLRPSIVASCLVAAALAGAASAETLYRYLDANGRVVYSDHPPPATAKDVQPKELPGNVIETDPVPLAARQAAERFPVTLYTFDCDICREAKALLEKRGVPFETVIVSEEKGAARLKALTGKLSAPVLQVGDKQMMQGYNEDRWQALLDEAGYPRTAPLARKAPSRTPPAKANALPPASAEDEAPLAPGQGYPK